MQPVGVVTGVAVMSDAITRRMEAARKADVARTVRGLEVMAEGETMRAALEAIADCAHRMLHQPSDSVVDYACRMADIQRMALAALKRGH